jgi:hypothetical protein
MALTVRRLITALKKMPPNAKVCFAAHDQDWHAGEYDGPVNYVDVIPESAREKHGYSVVIA